MSGGGICTAQLVQGDGKNPIGAACSEVDRNMSVVNLFCMLEE